MKLSLHISIVIVFMVLAACSSQEVKEDIKAAPGPDKFPAVMGDSTQGSNQNPPLTEIKDNKTLNLVRVMDGGACKNEYQGAKGAFLLYADPTDIERIKSEKGSKIFSNFETKIQNFSSEALQEAVNATNLAEDPFTLGADEAQEKLAKQLANHFRTSIAAAIISFQQETTLTIDIVPFAPSLIFYQQGCAAPQLEPEI